MSIKHQKRIHHEKEQQAYHPGHAPGDVPGFRAR
jgi:hypothetical protein